jgi:glycerophosphoryl diester phosphodiesterase
VDDVETLELLIARRVDGIFTNFPDRLRSLL